MLKVKSKHRLCCGDSTSRDDVDLLMAGEKADMVFTDPPYGMNLDTDYTSLKKKGYHSKQSTGNKYDEIIGDQSPFTAKPLLDMFDYCKEIFLFGADYYIETIERDHENLGSWIVWDKRTTKEGSTTLDKQFGSCFELCWSKQRHKREIARILHAGCFSVENDKRQHPSQKPVELPKWFIDKYAVESGNVADLFLGSGSTLIACEKTGRKCYGMEIDPHYCSVIIKRYIDFANGVVCKC